MKKYTINVIETLVMEVVVEAETSAAARDMVERGYKNGHYVLTPANLKQVNFTARTAERSRSYGR